MKTTATNRKVRELLTSLRDKKLVPNPYFQRRLVWTNRDKSRFLDTVLNGFPFPEVFVAAGSVDVDTGEATEMLVDGQQRITTLFQYFIGASDLKLEASVLPYKQLDSAMKEAFLQYDVVVRDLGSTPQREIVEVFRRINATKYGLNAMEIHNARYEGAFKQFAEQLAQHDFFERHRVFSATEIRRMEDTRYLLVVLTTILDTYFSRDQRVEEYLEQYNDEFPHKEDAQRELEAVLAFIDSLSLSERSRAFKKTDLFTLLVESHFLLYSDSAAPDPAEVGRRLSAFYTGVDRHGTDESTPWGRYKKATLQGANDRTSRVARGDIIAAILRGEEIPDAAASPHPDVSAQRDQPESPGTADSTEPSMDSGPSETEE
jgi:hypothetical protein